MNDDQENRFSVFKAVQQILNENLTVIATPDAFPVAKAAFDNQVSAIDAAATFNARVLRALPKTRRPQLRLLFQKVWHLLGPARGYASSIGNHTLFRVFDYSRSELEHLRDTDLVIVLEGVRDNLQSNILELAGHGITPEAVADFGTAIAVYNTLVSAPRASISAAGPIKIPVLSLLSPTKEFRFAVGHKTAAWEHQQRQGAAALMHYHYLLHFACSFILYIIQIICKRTHIQYIAVVDSLRA